MKLWLQKREMTFWHWMPMIFFRLRRKLVKIKSFLKLQNLFLHAQLRKSWLVKMLFWSSNSAWETKTGLGKNLKLTLIMSLGHTAHSIWASSHEQIGRTQTKKKRRHKDILNIKQKLWDLCLSVQFSLVTRSCPTLCNPMNRSTPGLPVHHQLPEFTQIRVHWVSDAI